MVAELKPKQASVPLLLNDLQLIENVSARSDLPEKDIQIGERCNTEMADVLIAGGGIAGSILAVILGRRGLSVELFDHGHFPREKPCGEGLMPAGVAVLERLCLARTVRGAHPSILRRPLSLRWSNCRRSLPQDSWITGGGTWTAPETP